MVLNYHAVRQDAERFGVALTIVRAGRVVWIRKDDTSLAFGFALDPYAYLGRIVMQSRRT